MLKFRYNPEIHHRKSHRLQDYDYSMDGFYFITLVCYNRCRYFGKIQKGEMILNELGKVAFEEWYNTPNVRPYVVLHAFVVMPDHLHGIIEIKENPCNSPKEQRKIVPNPEKPNISQNTHSTNPKFKSPSHTIGAIIRGYKSSVTRKSKGLIQESKIWQRDYYDSIIRNKIAFNNITNYILNNPKNWGLKKKK